MISFFVIQCQGCVGLYTNLILIAISDRLIVIHLCVIGLLGYLVTGIDHHLETDKLMYQLNSSMLEVF